MPGERILVVDDSQAIQDVVRATLQEFGYLVEVASNGAAALSHPNIKAFQLLIVDADMENMSGRDTARLWRGNEATAGIPVLLLVPEEKLDARTSEELGGAWSWLAKPFEPSVLKRKVRAMIEEQRILQRSEEYIAQAADRRMAQLADQQIQAAVERKTQIIIERAIQNVITQVDQRARVEVDQRVTSLTQEKEQELVRMTVREVANSMVEKLAERKVNEAIDMVLHDKTENAVRRAADNALPTLCRDQIHEQLELRLPEAVEMKVSEVAESQASEIGAKLVSVVEGVAQKSIPKIVNEKLPDLAERHLTAKAQVVLPPIVHEIARVQLDELSEQVIGPQLGKAERRLKRTSLTFLILTVLVSILAVGAAIVTIYAGGQIGSGGLLGQAARPGAATQQAAPAPTPAAP